MDQDVDLRKYIGKNYEEYNCLDLVREVYKDFLNLDIKPYYEGKVPGREEIGSLINTNRGDFVLVQGEKKFLDLVVIKLYGIESHLGVYVGRNKFLHSAKNIGSNIDRVERYSRIITGYYRHRDLAT